MRDTSTRSMLILPGGNALSQFRSDKILERIQSRLPNCSGVTANFIHFAEVEGEIDPAKLKTLERLLHYGDHSPAQHDGDLATDSWMRIVMPRIGTISPWSTKATDIAHRCGLTAILRVERGVEWRVDFRDSKTSSASSSVEEVLLPIVHDPMTESMLPARDAEALFQHTNPSPLNVIDMLGGGLDALQKADAEFGFALSEEELNYLLTQFKQLGRNPTDVELMMFAQVNSEHCRHKIFNADWRVDGVEARDSLFDMIRETHRQNGAGTLVAYHDNAAVLVGDEACRFQADPNTRVFGYQTEPVHYIAKVETHNHPTAISPFAGAATGSGGEIRDEGASGRGGKPKFGMVGYSVSHLRVPDGLRSWEEAESKPQRIASPLQIMLDGPLGAAAFNNEFGRPTIVGYFRTFEQAPPNGDDAFRHGYHKPIMIAGGVGNIRDPHVKKNTIPDGAPIVVLGGPAMLIGLGGGAASSVAAGSSSESVDYASVQRGNPEMQRRCQEVIDSCCALGEHNPIVSIHDVGAGGLCNALPELIHDSVRGGEFELRDVLNDEPGMTPLQVWCNESQERYVLAIDPSRFSEFEKICDRERCLYAKVGHANATQDLQVSDRYFSDDGKPHSTPIELPMDMLFGLPPTMKRDVTSIAKSLKPLKFNKLSVESATKLVLGFPSVADKTFLVTIGDRSVTGLISRDQMVGPWQVPVADVGVAASGYRTYQGEAMAVGERTPLAVIDAPASGRMAVGEAITNIAAARINDISNIKLSANWMVAAGEPGHDADLFHTVQSVAMELCPKLGISIPVGKDSMSMKSVWHDQAKRECKVVSPLSLIVTAFSAVHDIRTTLTPQLDSREGQDDLWLLDLGKGNNRLGGSVLAQATSQMGDAAPDVTDAKLLKNFFQLIQTLAKHQQILAYHDRSDGGLIATLCEMAFTARCGLAIDIGELVAASKTSKQTDSHLAVLFNEELGAVIQTRKSQRQQVTAQFQEFGMNEIAHRIGHVTADDEITIRATDPDHALLQMKRMELHQRWSETTWRMQRLRDNPECADQEYARISDSEDRGLFSKLTFDHHADIAAPTIAKGHRPKIAILREQGVNGQLEMAAAFDLVGFDAVDVTMSDLVESETLTEYKGFAACGGFSFGDVLGAGEGWAKSILYNNRVRDMFAEFFQRDDTFALGVCNGCQMMASIAELIPGAEHWPKFIRNKSEQYEARVVMLEICSDKSILLREMKGSMFPVSTAHGEGMAELTDASLEQLKRNQQVCMRFVDHRGEATEIYPANSNGSSGGVTGFTNADGRFTIMMPHPERVLRAACNSWRPSEQDAREDWEDWGEYSPWIRLFRNARVWVD